MTALDDIDTLPNTVVVGDENHVDHHNIIHAGIKALKARILSETDGAVKLSGNQTVGGIKTFSGTLIVSNPTADNHAANKAYVDGVAAGKEPAISPGTSTQYWAGDKTWKTLDKSAVGLSNVDNTSDLDKPISAAMQQALNQKANLSEVVTLSGNQTISGVKTFSSAPRLLTSSTIGHVWTATGTDGSGAWQESQEPSGDVSWDSILNKPSTFPPTIGNDENSAAPGDHTHTKSDIGLGEVDNTSDQNKPISNQTQQALNGRVGTSRQINTTYPLEGGGTLGSDLTLDIAEGGIDLSLLHSSAKRESIPFFHTSGRRAIGFGDLAEGIFIPYDFTISYVRYRLGTADGSGTTTVRLVKNGVPVSGTSGNASTSPASLTGPWSFAQGDILKGEITAIGSSPGERLYIDIVGYKTS